MLFLLNLCMRTNFTTNSTLPLLTKSSSVEKGFGNNLLNRGLFFDKASLKPKLSKKRGQVRIDIISSTESKWQTSSISKSWSSFIPDYPRNTGDLPMTFYIYRRIIIGGELHLSVHELTSRKNKSIKLKDFSYTPVFCESFVLCANFFKVRRDYVASLERFFCALTGLTFITPYEDIRLLNSAVTRTLYLYLTLDSGIKYLKDIYTLGYELARTGKCLYRDENGSPSWDGNIYRTKEMHLDPFKLLRKQAKRASYSESGIPYFYQQILRLVYISRITLTSFIKLFECLETVVDRSISTLTTPFKGDQNAVDDLCRWIDCNAERVLKLHKTQQYIRPQELEGIPPNLRENFGKMYLGLPELSLNSKSTPTSKCSALTAEIDFLNYQNEVLYKHSPLGKSLSKLAETVSLHLTCLPDRLIDENKSTEYNKAQDILAHLQDNGLDNEEFRTYMDQMIKSDLVKKDIYSKDVSLDEFSKFYPILKDEDLVMEQDYRNKNVLLEGTEEAPKLILKPTKKMVNKEDFDASAVIQFSQGLGKTRTVFIADIGSKFLFSSLGRSLEAILGNLDEEDLTFSQPTLALKLRNFVDKFNSIYLPCTSDATAFTDRFPIQVNHSLIKVLYGIKVADLWLSCIAKDRDFEHGGERHKYAVGTPMGLVTSWSSTAICHHLIVEYCIEKLGLDRDRTFKIILGDDISIYPRKLFFFYKKVCNSIGMEINLNKSTPGYSDMEMCKRHYYLKDGELIEVTGLSSGPLVNFVTGVQGNLECLLASNIYARFGSSNFNTLRKDILHRISLSIFTLSTSFEKKYKKLKDLRKKIPYIFIDPSYVNHRKLNLYDGDIQCYDQSLFSQKSFSHYRPLSKEGIDVEKVISSLSLERDNETILNNRYTVAQYQVLDSLYGDLSLFTNFLTKKFPIELVGPHEILPTLSLDNKCSIFQYSLKWDINRIIIKMYNLIDSWLTSEQNCWDVSYKLDVVEKLLKLLISIKLIFRTFLLKDLTSTGVKVKFSNYKEFFLRVGKIFLLLPKSQPFTFYTSVLDQLSGNSLKALRACVVNSQHEVIELDEG